MNPPAPDRTSHLARAELALSLAARALDPNVTPSPDFTLAGAMLSKALAHAALGLGAAPEETLAATLGALDDATLSRVAGSRARALELAGTVTEASRGEAVRSLSDAEHFAAQLVAFAVNGRRFGRAATAWRAARGLAVAVALTAAFYGFQGAVRGSYTFRMSSALSGYNAAGALPVTTTREIFCHSTDEESPWLEVDLGREREVSRVVVTNRFDCCRERATPMVVQVRGATGALREVARNDAEFDAWTAAFAPTRARYVRVMVPRRTILHLRNVEVR